MSVDPHRPSGVEGTEILDPSELPEDDAAAAEGNPTPRLQSGQHVHGRHGYVLRDPLGAGTFGSVWSADCVDIDRDAADIPPDVAAIKFFSISPNGGDSDYLRRELAALRSMRSRVIPRIYDWTLDEELSFFVMDYYRHGTLADLFRSGRQLDDDQAWRLLTALLQALRVAHRAGVLHLDIKPSNIVCDGTGGYHLIDFGISQASQVVDGPGRTVGAGSLGYQAPEQRRLELHRLDTRTDLWAVGATVWAARTGCDLARCPEKVHEDIPADQPSLPPLSTECPPVAPELDEIITGLVMEGQDARPGGAAAVLEQVRAATGAAVSHDPPGAEPRPHDQEEVDAVIDQLMDPLWSALCRRDDFRHYFAKFEDGDYLCREGRACYDAFVLLTGKVRIEQGGQTLGIDDREGMFIGEISTLTGTARAASVRAEGTVWTCMFNAAEFERLLAAHPSIGIRLLKLMAERIIHITRAHR